MFDSAYHFRKAGVQKGTPGHYIISLIIFTFDTENGRYIVEVEHYQNNFYIIKFYPKRFKNHPYKYNLLTSEFVGNRIIATCLRIIETILKKDPDANFGFVGSPTVVPEKDWREGQSNTKRFRIYKYAFESYFGVDRFTHYMNTYSSGYLIINNQNENTDQLMLSATRMFTELYPALS